MAKKLTPMTLLCGYLGAGKTTLLNRVLTNQKGYKVAVIVNDIGEVNVDAKLIADGAKITDTSSIVPLTNGCICCTLKTQLAQNIENIIRSGKFDYIMIEASGVCEPMPIAQELETIRNGRLDNVVGVVDAKRLVDEFAGGDNLLKDKEEDDIESLLVQQIEFCSTLVINKRDLVTDGEMKKVCAVISKLHPDTRIIEATKGDVPVEDIIGTGKFDFETVYASAGWCKALEAEEAKEASEGEEHHHKEEGDTAEDEDEYGISAFVYCRRKPFDRLKLDELASHWPKTIIRCKGMMWFKDEPDMAWVFETSGRQIQAGYSGTWLAAAPRREREAVLKAHPEIKKDWDEEAGDRMVRLCIIGQNMDKDAIEAALDGALA